MSSERIVVVGAGDHGRGVLEIIRRLQSGGERIEVAGFVDDSTSAERPAGVEILGNVDWLVRNLPRLDAAVVLAIADPTVKRELSTRLDLAGARYATILHPSSEIAPSATIAPGSIVGAGVIIIYEASVGRHVTINLNATIGHHVRIGDYSTIAPGANILGKVSIGESCQVNANATILPSIQIGDGAVVGAGSLVVANVPPGVTMFGNPARPLPKLR